MERLRVDLHGAILSIVENREGKMNWRDFGKKTGIPWDRHKHWKLKEAAIAWSPDRYIDVARKLGIAVEISVRRPGEARPEVEQRKMSPRRTGRNRHFAPGQLNLFEDSLAA